jgi:3-deoxy-manno-octulosonate cytidylyltransferase (CMP-KDO synthetase)
MTAVGVIPARFGASRFPGKPLAEIAGLPMIQRVYDGVRQAKSLSRVIVATEDERIVRACERFGAEVALTRSDHATGTDRLGEVAQSVDAEILVNIQGDEPLIEGFVVDAAVEALREDPEVPMATVVQALESDALDDPNRVKVVLDRRGRALYFSRSPIPHARGPVPARWQHVGLYAYRRPFLLDFVRLPRTPAEEAEQLEQLRALEHGFPIRCAVVEGWSGIAVDVPEDLARVEARLAGRGA